MENQNTEINPQVDASQSAGSLTYEGTEFDPAYIRRYSKEEWAEHATPRFYTHYNEKEQGKMLARVWDLCQPAKPAGKSSKK